MNIKYKNKYNYLPDCVAVRAVTELFSIPHAVGLWCGVKEEDLSDFLKEVEHVSAGIYKHPDIPCVRVKSQAIFNAINEGELPVCRETGIRVEKGDHVAGERRHIYGSDFKAWIEQAFPTEKPPFLFTELERNKYSGFTIEEYQTLLSENLRLKEENKTLEGRINNAIKIYGEQKAEIERLESENEKLKQPIGNTSQQSINKQNAVIAALALHISQDDKLLQGRSKAIAQSIINAVEATLILKKLPIKFISDTKLAEYISEGMNSLNP